MTAGIRSRRGHYAFPMLRDGYRDQYAVLRAGGKVVVELSYDGANAAPFVVTTIVTTPTTSRSTERTFTDLDEARATFRRIVSKNP